MKYQLDVPGILAAWEIGAARRPLDRALAILWAAGAGGDEAADLPLPERDRRLLSVRAGTFGPLLPTLATCPDCGAELEMELDTDVLAAALSESGDDGPTRALTSRDLAAVAALDAGELPAALRARLARAQDLPPEELNREIRASAEAAELSTRIECAGCGQEWVETLDVANHVWADVETAALRLLGEVAELAAAYGWSERDILGLSASRRAAYLSWSRA